MEDEKVVPLPKTMSLDNAFSKQRTLGLEQHVSSVFQQTRSQISGLSEELESSRKINEELALRLKDLQNQRQSLNTKNKQRGQALRERKREANL